MYYLTSAVKQTSAWLVIGWVIAWEEHLPLAFAGTPTCYYLVGTWTSISETRQIYWMLKNPQSHSTKRFIITVYTVHTVWFYYLYLYIYILYLYLYI